MIQQKGRPRDKAHSTRSMDSVGKPALLSAHVADGGVFYKEKYFTKSKKYPIKEVVVDRNSIKLIFFL